MTQTDDLRVETEGSQARIVLTRPRAINALTPAMMQAISEALQGWAEDEAVDQVAILGEGERGFCSGADVRAIRQLVLDDPQAAVDFFRVEYAVNELIATYPKPVVSHVHGISMGGGLGLAVHASRVVADEDLKLAMPETGIGLFPDVGVTWQLSRAPGQTGTYLAMTGTTIDAGSAQYAGLVHDVLLPAEMDEEFGAYTDSQLATDRAWIDDCFAGDDPVRIVQRLAEHREPRARETAELLRQRSPWSVAVALEQVRRAARMAEVGEVLAQDLVLATNFVADSDFVEGVRAQLVDKDRAPQWRHASLEQVDPQLVASMFEPR
ncbi:enoyl-CoA hydratase/isomerase family protein [Luteococcus peritonei]|uniref:3-hydroxyisobutyryl-CoA hydrolase n=1 Tax=Luteococcus peritonei TaxID=88874 RepID=A0ABW4RV69_9ACTN